MQSFSPGSMILPWILHSRNLCPPYVTGAAATYPGVGGCTTVWGVTTGGDATGTVTGWVVRNKVGAGAELSLDIGTGAAG